MKQSLRNARLELAEVLYNGMYTPGKLALYMHQNDGFCCLGVACMAGLASPDDDESLSTPIDLAYDEDYVSLPGPFGNVEFTREEASYLGYINDNVFSLYKPHQIIAGLLALSAITGEPIDEIVERSDFLPYTEFTDLS